MWFIVIIIIIFLIIGWCWLHWGKRGTRVAMTSTYYMAERALGRENPNIDQKTILIKTLQSRATYKNRPIAELKRIIDEHPTIEDLIDFVIKDEGQI